MSDTDSFIDEVTEEVRRDRLFAVLRRYGWIAVAVILLIVGAAAWREYSRAQAEAAAQALGDAIIAALENEDPSERAAALADVTAQRPGGQVIVTFHRAAALAEAGDPAGAVDLLDSVASDGELPEIYRQIAGFKALTLATGMDADERRLRLEALAVPGAPLRLLAEEQLALIEIEAGETDAAIARLRAIVQDAEAGADLQQRAAQVIVALGGAPVTSPDDAG